MKNLNRVIIHAVKIPSKCFRVLIIMLDISICFLTKNDRRVIKISMSSEISGIFATLTNQPQRSPAIAPSDLSDLWNDSAKAFLFY